MEPLLSTYSYSEHASLEEKMEQSNFRLEALKKIADYIDSPTDNQLGKIVDEFIKKPDCDEHDWDKLKEYNSLRNDFFTQALKNAIEEQRKAELKIKLICLLYEKVDYCFNKQCDVEKKFPNQTRKNMEKSVIYGYYVLDNVGSGRSVEDIFKLSFEKICIIADCECFERWAEIEQFAFDKKVGIQYLKRIIQLVNEDNNIELNAAFEQAKLEAKDKRESIKNGSALQKRCKLLRKRNRLLGESFDNLYAEYKESKKLCRKFQYRSEKWLKQNTELNEQIKAIKKALRKKFPDITEIKNIVGIADINNAEKGTKNNIIPNIINKVKYYPMIINNSYPITS